MTITSAGIELFRLLKQKFGEQEAETLVHFVDTKLKENNEKQNMMTASKEDLSLMKNDISTIKEDVLRLEIKMASMESRLTMKMFYFWIGQVAVMAGLLVYFFKFSHP